MFYERKIKYLDLYNKGERIQNAGFVRVEARENLVNLQLRIEKLGHTDNGKVQVVLKGEKQEAVLGEVMLEKGNGTLECKDLKLQDLTKGIGYEELCEIYIKLTGERVLKSFFRERRLPQEPEQKNVFLENEMRAASAEHEDVADTEESGEDEMTSEVLRLQAHLPEPGSMSEQMPPQEPQPMYEPTARRSEQMPPQEPQLMYEPTASMPEQMPPQEPQPMYEPTARMPEQMPPQEPQPMYEPTASMSEQKPPQEPQPMYEPNTRRSEQKPSREPQPMYEPTARMSEQMPPQEPQPMYEPSARRSEQMPPREPQPMYEPGTRMSEQMPSQEPQPMYEPTARRSEQMPSREPQPMYEPNTSMSEQMPSREPQPMYEPGTRMSEQMPPQEPQPMYEPNTRRFEQMPPQELRPEYKSPVAMEEGAGAPERIQEEYVSERLPEAEESCRQIPMENMPRPTREQYPEREHKPKSPSKEQPSMQEHKPESSSQEQYSKCKHKPKSPSKEQSSAREYTSANSATQPFMPQAEVTPRFRSEPGPVLRPMSTPPLQRRQSTTTKWQQLSDIYPHIRPFEDGRDYLKIQPEDFVILTQKYYPLSTNSFLKHGYYNYGHLILTREMRKDGEHFYIGVPGNFYDKEKQVAVLFGFESFEGKTEPAKNGDFGYYMISVEI